MRGVSSTIHLTNTCGAVCARVCRFASDSIYTFAGPVLVALNPCKPLPLYAPEVALQYRGACVRVRGRARVRVRGSCCSVLVALNPCKPLPLYAPEVALQYRGACVRVYMCVLYEYLCLWAHVHTGAAAVCRRIQRATAAAPVRTRAHMRRGSATSVGCSGRDAPALRQHCRGGVCSSGVCACARVACAVVAYAHVRVCEARGHAVPMRL